MAPGKGWFPKKTGSKRPELCYAFTQTCQIQKSKIIDYKRSMSWQTNPAVIGLRNVARKTGVIQFINQFLPRKKYYEQTFDTAMFEAIKPGDVIWDVGANVGYYTRKFSDSVGSAGQVFAFEPFPATAARLRAELTGVETVTVLPVALGAETGTVSMREGDDEFGATSRIVA